jgi:hypothetical protein
MFTRIAAIVQIAILVGCPFWCNLGWCASGTHCCVPHSEAKADSLPRCQATKKSCCQRHAAAKQQQAPNEQRPMAPGKCQCICGGAVLGEPIQSPGFNDLSSLFCLIDVESAPPSRNESSAVGTANGPTSSGACTGRELRTLIASLLC